MTKHKNISVVKAPGERAEFRPGRELQPEQKIVHCKEPGKNENYLAGLGIGSAKSKKILEKGYNLCRQIISRGKH